MVACAVIVFFVAAATNQSPLQGVIRPARLTLASAAEYHRGLHAAARKAELARGHRHTSALPPANVAVRHNGAVTIDPVSYGADPTGRHDSSAAFELAMEALLNHSTATRMASGIVDLGGRTLDLGGGVFLISLPLKIPPMFGNVHLRGGTLRASRNFPASEWLVSVGNSSCAPKLPDGSADQQASCGEVICVTRTRADRSRIRPLPY